MNTFQVLEDNHDWPAHSHSPFCIHTFRNEEQFIEMFRHLWAGDSLLGDMIQQFLETGLCDDPNETRWINITNVKKLDHTD